MAKYAECAPCANEVVVGQSHIDRCCKIAEMLETALINLNHLVGESPPEDAMADREPQSRLDVLENHLRSLSRLTSEINDKVNLAVNRIG